MSVSCFPVFQISSLITISCDLTVAHSGVACHRATEGRADICSKGPWQRTKDPVVFPSQSGAHNLVPSFSVYGFTCKGQFRELTQLIPNHCGAERIVLGYETSI